MEDPAQVSLVDIDLEPRQVMLGAPREWLRGRVRLGVPAARPVSRAGLVELGLERFAGVEGDGRAFCEVDFTVNFMIDRQSPMLDAVVGVVLNDDSGGGDHPIIRSVTPVRSTDGSVRSSHAVWKVTTPVGGPQFERTTSNPSGVPYVIAEASGDQRTRWSFTSTKDHELAGTYDLKLVIELRAGAPASALLEAAATVRHRTLGVVRYKALVPPDLKVTKLPNGG